VASRKKRGKPHLAGRGIRILNLHVYRSGRGRSEKVKKDPRLFSLMYQICGPLSAVTDGLIPGLADQWGRGPVPGRKREKKELLYLTSGDLKGQKGWDTSGSSCFHAVKRKGKKAARRGVVPGERNTELAEDYD